MIGHEVAVPLRDAALAGRLGDWTRSLTRVVVAACARMGWQAAAKDHRSPFLPVPRSEYLALDVVAFDPVEAGRWRFPLAAIELENQRDDDYVAYALWKVLCVRAASPVQRCASSSVTAGTTRRASNLCAVSPTTSSAP